MSADVVFEPRAGAAAALQHAMTTTRREAFVDVFRGLLIAHMALDHASLMFNAGRGAEELAAVPPAAPTDVLQFLTRFTGIPVAPAFCFMAGFMVALTSSSRADRGISDHDINRRLWIRGLVLIGVDAVIMGLPRAANGFYSFMVLSSIGASIILLSLVRRWPSRVLLPVAFAVLALHPLIDLSGAPVALRAILYEPVRTGAFRSLYPIIPWSAIVVVGFVVGRDALSRKDSTLRWLALAAGCFFLFFAVRLAGGYGNAYAYTSISSFDFWSFAKYPPDLAFLSWSFAAIFAGLALLSRFTRSETPLLLRPFVVFGRVPFFFYVVHFYVLGAGMAILRSKFGLPATYLIWIALLLVMAWPCAWYYRKKRERPNLVTRYF